MASIHCARCGTVWGAADLDHGEMSPPELRCFFEGLGCAWCWSGVAPQTDTYEDRFLADCLAATSQFEDPKPLLDGLAIFCERQLVGFPILLLKSGGYPARGWTVHV